MRNRVRNLVAALLGGVYLTLLALVSTPYLASMAAEGTESTIHYVATGQNCGGAQPCYSSIQAAVDAAAPGDVIRVASGTYTDMHTAQALKTSHFTPTQMVVITQSLTLGGGYNIADWSISKPEANPTILDAQGTGRAVVVIGTQATLYGLDITNGEASELGGEPGPFGPQDAGGGMYISEATLNMENCRIRLSSAAHHGGGIHITKASHVTIANSSIYSNTQSGAPQGGNRAGGGVYVNDRSQLTLINSLVTGNSAASWAGGVAVFDSGASVVGGRICDNTAGYEGGGLALFFATADVSQAEICNNSAGSEGGGIKVSNRAVLTLTNSVVYGNQATRGGAIYVTGSPDWPSRVSLIHATLASNGVGPITEAIGTSSWTRGSEGQVISITLQNTIIASHTIGLAATAADTTTIEIHADHTLWSDVVMISSTSKTGTGFGSIGVTTVNDLEGDPAFDDPSAGDYHIKLDSAAIDAGKELGILVDINGEARPFGAAPDIGADEWATAETAVTPLSAATIVAVARGLTTTVEIPAGAVTESTALKYTALANPLYSAPDNFSFAGQAFAIDAYRNGVLVPDFLFTKPVTLTIHYSDDNVANLDENSLILRHWNGSAWVDVATTCSPASSYARDVENNWLRVAICHLSDFALFGESQSQMKVYLPLVLR